MPLLPLHFERLAALLEAGERPARSVLRAALDGMNVLLLDAAELSDETPYLRLGQADVHLIAGSVNCISLTREPERASGVILAWQQ